MRRLASFAVIGALLAALLAVLLAACTAASTPSSKPAPTTSPQSSGSSAPTSLPGSPTATASLAAVVSEAPVASRPPDAVLAAEGGDPVKGALGTYTWAEGGSDSPWLTGSPIHVGAREPLVVTLQPDTPVASWTARYVPATADGPDGAIELASGTGTKPPAFTAPPHGSWTVELQLTFADRAGAASYAWAVTVD